MARFVAFDVETPNRWNDRMSAIGITVLEDGEIVEEFYSLVDPEVRNYIRTYSFEKKGYT